MDRARKHRPKRQRRGDREVQEYSDLATPPRGVSSVCLEEVAMKMSQLNMQGAGGANAQVETPKTRQRGLLQQRQLFATTTRRTALPPWSAIEISALICFVLLHTGGKTWP